MKPNLYASSARSCLAVALVPGSVLLALGSTVQASSVATDVLLSLTEFPSDH